MMTGFDGIELGSGLEGNRIKVLRIAEETGAYSLLIHAPIGRFLPPRSAWIAAAGMSLS